MRQFLFLFVFAVIIFACAKEEAVTTTDCSGVAATYTANVKAILDANCATSGCHSASSKQDGIDLSTYAAAKSVAGQAKFLGSIQQLSGYDAMPKGGKLSTDQIKTLTCWVQNGILEN